ncbi:hypothetical protein [Vibrio owensii]|uniref:hypothetical protein n=1 Tax=Vibrio harveyi group TaxID=717610 RepID=UPI003CC62378
MSKHTIETALAYCEQFGLDLSDHPRAAIEAAEALKLAADSGRLHVTVDGVRSVEQHHDYSNLYINPKDSNIHVVSVQRTEEGIVNVYFSDEQDYEYAQASLGQVTLTSELLQKTVDAAIKATKGISKPPGKYGEPLIEVVVE